MQLGFVTAILPELTLEEVASVAADIGYDCVEVMCWPRGNAARRYAGITHIDVTDFTAADASRVKQIMAQSGVSVSALGYYPNPLAADAQESAAAVAHIKRVITASRLLGLGVMNTFVGRDPTQSVDANWPRMLEIWRPIIAHAEAEGVKVGIENCPMSFTKDEWPGGKNLATSPAIWRRMFSDIPSGNFGLNFDPSHFVWQQMDIDKAMKEFSSKLFHIHAKDARVDLARRDEVGILAYPNQYHTPKLPGMGDVNWGQFFASLNDAGYRGPVCVEVEDRAYEGALENRKSALRTSYNFLRQFIA